MKRKLIAPFLIVLVLVGCATFTTNSYRALVVSNETYDKTLTAMGELYREGKITEEQKAKAIELGHIFKTAHNQAVDAVAKYEESDGFEGKEQALNALQALSTALANLIAYCRPLIEGGN